MRTSSSEIGMPASRKVTPSSYPHSPSYVLAMSGFTAGFSPEDFDLFKGLLQALGERQGSFDSNDALWAIVQPRFEERGSDANLGDAGDVIEVLKVMEELDYVERVDPGSPGPHRWAWVGEEAGTLKLPPS